MSGKKDSPCRLIVRQDGDGSATIFLTPNAAASLSYALECADASENGQGTVDAYGAHGQKVRLSIVLRDEWPPE